MNPNNTSTKSGCNFSLIKCYKNEHTFKVHRYIEYAIIENGKLTIVFEDDSCIIESIDDYERITIE